MDSAREQLKLLEQQRLRAVRGLRRLTAVLNYIGAARAELEALREDFIKAGVPLLRFIVEMIKKWRFAID